MNEPEQEEPPRIRVAPLRVRITGPEPANGGQARKLPVVTIALLGVITATTALEFALAHSTDPPPAMLMALGGMNSSAVLDGDWYRLITAALLHGGILHLLFNGIALFLGGAIVESLANRGWLIFIAVASAISGSALGVVLNDESIVSVGASGSIMGILAAAMVLAFRVEAGPHRNQLLGSLARFLIPSLLPLATGGSGVHVDYSAHIGGAIGGALIGGVILFGRLFDKVIAARVVAIASVSLVAASVSVETRRYSEQAENARLDRSEILVPDNQIPKDWEVGANTVDDWGKGHPRDPRIALFRGIRVVSEEEATETSQGREPPSVSKSSVEKAENDLRQALADKAVLHKFFGDRKLETTLRGVLCTLLKNDGKLDEAKKEAAPVCDAGDGGSVPDVMKHLGLCPNAP